MKQTSSKVSCADFQEKLPELIGANENIASHPHLQTCDLCRSLLADLETIAEAARQLFPVVEPRDDLWMKIASALESEDSRPEHRTK